MSNPNDSSDISEDDEEDNRREGNAEIYDDPEGEEDLPSNNGNASD